MLVGLGQWCHHRTGTHRRRANIEDGVAQWEARNREERTCFRATAAHVWWSLRENSVAGGLKRPRRSCGDWCAPRRRAATDSVPEPVVQKMDMPPGLFFGEGSCFQPSWARGVLQERETRCRRPSAVSQRGGGRIGRHRDHLFDVSKRKVALVMVRWLVGHVFRHLPIGRSHVGSRCIPQVWCTLTISRSKTRSARQKLHGFVTGMILKSKHPFRPSSTCSPVKFGSSEMRRQVNLAWRPGKWVSGRTHNRFFWHLTHCVYRFFQLLYICFQSHCISFWFLLQVVAH